MIQRHVDQRARAVQPFPLGGELVQRQQTGGQHGVVLQDRDTLAHQAAEAGSPQPAIDDVQGYQTLRTAAGHLQQRGVLKCDGGLRQGGDRQPVPGGDDLVIAPGLRSGSTHRQQRRAHPLEAGDIIGIARQLQNRTAVFEGTRFSNLEKCCSPTSVVGTEHLTQLLRRPYIGGALHPGGIGVQRRGEHVTVAEIVDQECRGFCGHPTSQRVTGPPGPVRVDPQQQCVVVEHLLEVRHHPLRVDGVAGEPAGQLVVDAAAGHRLTSAPHRRQRNRRSRTFVAAQQRLQ